MIDHPFESGTLPAMRSMSILLTAALGLTSLAACDKGEAKDASANAGEKAEEKPDAKADAKADAKKEGEEQVAANAEEDPEAGCIHEKKEDESCEHEEAPAAGASTGHFGAEFAVADTQGLSAVLAGTLPTEAVKVSGTVEAVCQKKGCWMVMKDGDMQARVLVKDHAFAIPMDGKGKAAVVEGTLEEKQLDEANVAHLKKDGDDTLEGDGPRKEFFLHATAVELQPNA